MIKDLELKLNGTIPINRDELVTLIDSWGRSNNSIDNNYIRKCEPKECYPLENLDISKITNLSYVFAYSLYNGDKRFKNNNSLLFLNF